MKKELWCNKRNNHKFLLVHKDGYGHTTIKQFILAPQMENPNFTGDGCFHRWRKQNRDSLLEDYFYVSEALK
jgi:hypothetical protein